MVGSWLGDDYARGEMSLLVDYGKEGSGQRFGGGGVCHVLFFLSCLLVFGRGRIAVDGNGTVHQTYLVDFINCNDFASG